MYDRYQRQITYLRISVTECCNMRCFYCRPGQGGACAEDGMSIDDIVRVVRAGASVGIRKLRLTGGEPLVRTDIVKLTDALAAVPGIDDIAITTNGILLKRYAKSLKEAGLKRVNVSLDSLRPGRFREITRTDAWQDVMDGIEAALDAGLEPVKLNTVVMRGINDDEIYDFACLAFERPLHVRFIELMPIGTGSDWSEKLFISADELRNRLLSAFGQFKPVGCMGGSGPAKYWQLPGGRGTIGFIAPLSGYFCSACNRLRLTAAGTLRPCLCQGHEIDIKPLLAAGAAEDELRAAIVRAIEAKPEGNGENGIIPVKDKLMSQIGG